MDSTPLIVVVSGGGPVGLTFSLNLVMLMGKKVKIIIYEVRWFVDENGIVQWQGEQQGKLRRDQVVTLQDHVMQQMPGYIREGLFRNINERVWPTSRNIPIREVEDRLFDLIQPFVHSGQIELVPERLNEQTECLIKGNFDVLVGTDGSNSFVRHYCNIQMISEGIEYACGVAYHIPDQVPSSEEPLHQALNCILTVSQTRYLVNSSTSRRGYLNIRLIQSEYDELNERLQEFQQRNEPLDLLDFNKCPQSPVWTIIRQGLEFFKIGPRFVFRVVPIEINVRHASIVVREIRIEVKDNHPQLSTTTVSAEIPDTNHKKYKTALAFLAGDAAMNVHFWPGRGMNSGMKSAIALARNILRSCTSKTNPNSIVVRTPFRFLDFLDYEGFMARLRAREQQGRSLRVLVDPIDSAIEESYAYAHLNHCYVRYTKNLIEKLKETRVRLQERSEWPHKNRPITDEELQSATSRISSYSVAQLSLANPWPTREMSGAEVLVEDTYPFDLKNFLCVPTAVKTAFSRLPSVLIRQRFLSLWLVGEPMSELTQKLVKIVQQLPNFTGAATTTADSHPGSPHEPQTQLVVVGTIEKAKEWIKANRELIRRPDTVFKVVTVWSPANKLTAVDVIRAVRIEEAHVPVLVFTNKREKTLAALEFPCVSVTNALFDLYEFIGVHQEIQWNAGCRVSCSKKDIKPAREVQKCTPSGTINQSSIDSCPYPLYDHIGFPKPTHFTDTSSSVSDVPPSPRISSACRHTQLRPMLFWIDYEQNNLKTMTDLNQNYPQLKIHFVPTLGEARLYLIQNAQQIKNRHSFSTICKDYYQSESKNALDVVRLFDELHLSVPIGVYTNNRTALKQNIPNIPERVQVFDQEHHLLVFVRNNLYK